MSASHQSDFSSRSYFLVLADPEPDDVIAVHNPEDPIIVGDARGVQRPCAMNFLELKTVVLRIVAKSSIGGSCALLN